MNDNIQEERIHTTRSGAVFHLRPVSPVVVRQLKTDWRGKPQPPIVEVSLGSKGKKEKVANTDDPEYLAALAAWTEEKETRTLTYIWTMGVCDEPSAMDRERILEFFPGATATEIKSIWIKEQLVSFDDIGELTENILGFNIVTEGGIRQAEETFLGDSEQPTNTADGT